MKIINNRRRSTLPFSLLVGAYLINLEKLGLEHIQTGVIQCSSEEVKDLVYFIDIISDFFKQYNLIKFQNFHQKKHFDGTVSAFLEPYKYGRKIAVEYCHIPLKHDHFPIIKQGETE